MIHNNIIYNSDLNGNIESKGKIWNLISGLNLYILLQNNVKDTIFIFNSVKYLTYGYAGNSYYLSKTWICNQYDINPFCFRPIIEFKE